MSTHPERGLTPYQIQRANALAPTMQEATRNVLRRHDGTEKRIHSIPVVHIQEVSTLGRLRRSPSGIMVKGPKEILQEAEAWRSGRIGQKWEAELIALGIPRERIDDASTWVGTLRVLYTWTANSFAPLGYNENLWREEVMTETFKLVTIKNHKPHTI